MMGIESFVAVVSIWTVAVITPGPNFFITARTASAVSRLSAFYVVTGICTGTAIWGVCGFLGLTALFLIAPWLYLFIRIAGAVYLVWLGINLLIKAKQGAGLPDFNGKALPSGGASWRLGLMTILSNPKTAIFVTSLFATALPQQTPIAAGILSVGLMTVISLAWYSLVMLLFSSETIVKGYHKLQRWMDGLAGCLFIGFGLRLIFQEK